MNEPTITLDESEVLDAQPTYWIPEGLSVEEDSPSQEDFLVETDQQFHCGNWTDTEKARVLACKHCGGTHFEIAQLLYWTGIRCVVCKWECQIHEG